MMSFTLLLRNNVHASSQPCRTILRLLPTRSSTPSSSLSSRRLATKVRTLTPKQTQYSHRQLSPPQQRMQYLANKFLAEGKTKIYTAPSHIKLLGMTWLIGVGFLFYAGNLLYDIQTNISSRPGMTSGQSWLVGVGYNTGFIAAFVIGSVAIWRYVGLVKTIQLIPGKENARLQVTVRRAVPIVPARVYQIAPYEFKIANGWTDRIQTSALRNDARKARSLPEMISRILFRPFSAARGYWSKDGIVGAGFPQRQAQCMLDVRQLTPKEAERMAQIVTTEEAWERW